jgi:hypothetical protein
MTASGRERTFGGCSRLVNFVLANCSWDDGTVRATFREFFEMLSGPATAAARLDAGATANPAKSEIWLPFLEAYRTMCIAPQPGFRRILEEARSLAPPEWLRSHTQNRAGH